MGSRRMGLMPFLSEGVFTQDGPAWKHSSEFVRRQFARLCDGGLATFIPHGTGLLDAIAGEGKHSLIGAIDL
jgi:hypothetical protein